MVIHATIDGYSRLPLYCHCSNTNRAETVLFLFEIHMDYLQELDVIREVKIAYYIMLSHPLRGPSRGSVISGRSIHNQRIERFWRDVFTFYRVYLLILSSFYHLEDSGILNCDDPIHLWCLHLIYIPYINLSLTTFVDRWENHPMSSVRGLSPRQLIMGARNVRQLPFWIQSNWRDLWKLNKWLCKCDVEPSVLLISSRQVMVLIGMSQFLILMILSRWSFQKWIVQSLMK